MNKIFISMRTGKRYEGEFPEQVSHPYSEHNGNIIATKVETAKKGDPNYEKVLVAFMFARGYLEDKDEN